MWRVVGAFGLGVVTGIGLIVWLAEVHMRRVRRALRGIDDRQAKP